MADTFRYSSPLIVPESSSIKDRITQEEMTYVFNALRTLATQLDKSTGALSPLPGDWPNVDPITSIISGNQNKFYCQCQSAINYGAFVNFVNTSPTTVQARPAKASGPTLAAGGFCNTPGGFAAGAWGEFITGSGINAGISGLVPGNWYFLDPTTATGQVTATAPSTVGQVYQLLGLALTDKRLMVGAMNTWQVI